MDPELMKAVRERVELGHDETAIRQELKDAGYTDVAIDEVMAAAHHPISDHAAPEAVGTASPEGPIVLPGAGELFTQGWRFARANISLAFLLALPLLGMAFAQYYSTTPAAMGNPAADLVVGLGTLVAFIVYFYLLASVLKIATTNEETGDFSSGWRWASGHVGGYFWIMVLSMLVVWGGLLLFIIPGIIVSMMVYFAQYVYVVEGHRGMAALLRSRQLVCGYWGALFGRLLLLGLMYFGIIIVLGVLFGVVVGLAGLTLEAGAGELLANLGGQVLSAIATLMGFRIGFILYQRLAHGRPASADVATKGRGKYVALAWLGVLFPIAMIFVFGSLFLLMMGTSAEYNSPEVDTTDFEAKLRAMELRADQDLQDLIEEMDTTAPTDDF